jgi:ABC-type thiamin/hydroxymethylpyrimidine transport system permease subunit
MAGVDWKLRVSVFLQRLWQPTFACMTCMTAPTFANLLSAAHWKLALQTGVGTGILALLLTFTPVGRLFTHRYGNALLVGALTAIADAWSHPGRFGIEYGEALLTGLVSGLLALAGWFLLEDRARRVRHAWARIRAMGVPR